MKAELSWILAKAENPWHTILAMGSAILQWVFPTPIEAKMAIALVVLVFVDYVTGILAVVNTKGKAEIKSAKMARTGFKLVLYSCPVISVAALMNVAQVSDQVNQMTVAGVLGYLCSVEAFSIFKENLPKAGLKLPFNIGGKND